MRSPIIEYANILNRSGVGSEEARAYRHGHESDAAFVRRAQALEELFANKARVLHALRSERAGPADERPLTDLR